MAFVPGFDHDVFISYAHGDDRDWITRFVDRLEPALARRLPGATVWIDKDDLRKDRNFEQDIPANLLSTAVLISLVSPTYITRPYCVHHECRRFGELATARKQPGQRFAAQEFASDLFGFRCPILPMQDNAYWNDLIPGATDIPFCDDVDTYPIASAPFEAQFRVLLRGLVDLLRRMRNRSTSVLVYPRRPPAELEEPHAALTRELNARSFRVLPEDELDPVRHVPTCELAVMLLGKEYEDNTRRLITALAELNKRFLIWPSPALESGGTLEQRGFLQYLAGLESGQKTLLGPAMTSEKLKQEVLALLNPQTNAFPAPPGKPRVYLIYESGRGREKDNAGKIAFHFREDFHFEHSDDPRRHIPCLTQSDGVLLVWGDAGEEWCASEFEQVVRLSQQARSRGLCLFDPKESKVAATELIRGKFSDPPIHVAEEFGAFDPSRLESFFNPIRRLQVSGT